MLCQVSVSRSRGIAREATERLCNLRDWLQGCRCAKFEVNGVGGREEIELLDKAISRYKWAPALPGASPQIASHLLCC